MFYIRFLNDKQVDFTSEESLYEGSKGTDYFEAPADFDPSVDICVLENGIAKKLSSEEREAEKAEQEEVQRKLGAQQKRKALKLRLQANMLVQTSTGTFDFTEETKGDFGLKVGSYMADTDTLLWYDSTNAVHQLTRPQALEIVAGVTEYRYVVKIASEADRAAIESGDFSLSNLRINR